MNIKSIIGIVLAVLLLGGAGFWFYSQSQQTATSHLVKTETVRRGDIAIVGINPNYPPMEFTNANSDIVGFDIDLMKAVFAKIGMPYEVKSIVWDDKTEELNSGNIDLIWSSLIVTEERKQIYDTSNAYLQSEQVYVVSAKSSINSVEQLAGVRVAMRRGAFILPNLEKLASKLGTNFASINQYSDVATAMVALLTAKADVAVANDIVVRYHTSHSPGKFRILKEKFGASKDIVVAAKKGNTELIKKINNAIDSLKADGSYDEIYNKWFGA